MRKLSNIQVLRGLAALAVVVFHARDRVDDLGLPIGLPSFLAGAFGVDVFFVISGLVMVYASLPLFGAARSTLPFLGRRLARIVPLYWTVTALFVLFDPSDARADLGRDAFRRFLALSLAFVPYVNPVNADATPVYTLGWTLDYEMAFYVALALVLALPRRGAVAALACGCVGLVASNKVAALPGWLSYLGASNILEFAAGLVLAELALSGWRLPRHVALALVAVALAAVLVAAPFSDDWWQDWRGVVWGVPAAAVVGAAALCPSPGPPGPLRGGFERLGDASYALYLIHDGLFMILAAAPGGAGPLAHLSAGPVLLILVVVAVLAGFAVHLAFERPVTRWLQRFIDPRRPPSVAVAEP